MEQKEALEYLVNLGQVETIEIGNQTFATKQLHLVKAPLPAALKVRSLTGLVDYLKSDFDKQFKQDLRLLIHIESPTVVSVLSITNENESRTTFIEATAQLPEFRYGNFYDVEEFIIALQAKFCVNQSRSDILRLVGNIKEENVRQVGDNGISQAVTAKTGVATVDTVVVPNPVYLAPYRTFIEVSQPESAFVFRMQNGPRAALYEADGGAWKNDAMKRIADYLLQELADEVAANEVIIIA